jgi:hypothetical protein
MFPRGVQFDIAAFGYAMRKRAKDSTLNAWEGVFSRIGQGVLWALCVLIIVGWLLVGQVVPSSPNGLNWALLGWATGAGIAGFIVIWSLHRFYPS